MRTRLQTSILCAVALSALCLAAGAPQTVRGTLMRAPDGEPAVKIADGEIIHLEGDKETAAVIRDERLHGRDFEAAGEFTKPGHFHIAPRYTKSMWVWQDGEKLDIIYWCSVCSIRTYAPGVCMCCQEETALDLRPEEE